MLSFDIRTLESAAAQVDGDLPADDPIWTETDTRPLDAVHVEGRFSSAGNGRFYFSGSFSGAVKLECRKCLTEVTQNVSESVVLSAKTTGPGGHWTACRNFTRAV